MKSMDDSRDDCSDFSLVEGGTKETTMDEAKKEQVEYIEVVVKFDPEEIFEEALKHIDEMKIARRSAKIEVVSFS